MNKTNEHHLILIETMLEGCEEDGEKATEYVKHLIEENEKLKEQRLRRSEALEQNKILFGTTFSELMKHQEENKKLKEDTEKLKEQIKILFDTTFGKKCKTEKENEKLKEDNEKLNDEIKKLKEENAQLEFGIKCMRAEFHYHGDNANIDDYEAFNDFLKSEYPEQYEEMYEWFNLGWHLDDGDSEDSGDD